MNTLTKYAFFTMDLESFYDTSCVRKKKPQRDGNNCYDGVINYLNILDKYNIKSTLFTVESSLDDNKELLKKAINDGHYVSIHGYTHDSIINIDNKEFEEKIIKSINHFENTLGVKPLGFRAPIFKIDNDKLNIIKNHFKYDSSALYNLNKLDELKTYKELNDNIYTNDSFYEIPPTSFKGNIGGGAFMRLTPWVIMKHKIKKYLKNHNSYCFYIHPFELSKSKKPNIKIFNPLDIIYLRFNFKSYPKKIEWLINYLKNNGFEFITIEDYIKKATA